jgi:hypothetical protein
MGRLWARLFAITTVTRDSKRSFAEGIGMIYHHRSKRKMERRYIMDVIRRNSLYHTNPLQRPRPTDEQFFPYFYDPATTKNTVLLARKGPRKMANTYQVLRDIHEGIR